MMTSDDIRNFEDSSKPGSVWKLDSGQRLEIGALHPQQCQPQLEEILWELMWHLLHMLHSFGEGKSGQKRILSILLQKEVTIQQELQERIQVKAGSLSETLKKLEEAGLVERRSCEQDRRKTEIRLTPSGQEEAERAVTARRQQFQELFTGLEQGEKQELYRLLKSLEREWSRRDEISGGTD